jgi:hypothetical protein
MCVAAAVDVEAPREGVQEHTLLEVVREGDGQVTVIGLLKPEAVVPHVRIKVLLPDKLGHRSSFGMTDDWSSS